MGLGTGRERADLRDKCAALIVTMLPDPSCWLFVVRAWVEALGMQPSRCIPLGGVTLHLVMFEVIQAMSADDRQTAERATETLRQTIETFKLK